MSKMMCRWGGQLVVCCLLAFPAFAAQGAAVQTDRELGYLIGTRAEMLAVVKRVGLLPPELPAGYDEREDVKELLQKTVSNQLREAGFEVVGGESYQAVYDQLNRQVGGVYDPDTGALKRERNQGVILGARQEFIKSQKVDALVLVGIRLSTAKLRSSVARWSHVIDNSVGRRRDAMTVLLASPDVDGTLPAYDVTLQVLNPEGKVLFSRNGGLQLAAYFDIAKASGGYKILHANSSYGFLTVPSESMFRDSARMERAVRIATQPLRYSGEEIAAGEEDKAFNPERITADDLPEPPEAVKQSRESPLRAERSAILSSVHRVAITSLEANKFTPSVETQQRYLELVRAELAPLGWDVVLVPAAYDQLRSELARAGSLFDPITGKFLAARASAARKAVMGSFGGVSKPEATLWLSLTRTIAQQKDGDAEWDGATQSAITLGPAEGFAFFTTPAKKRAKRAAGEGAIEALSLHVQLRDMSDQVLYESRGGIQLLQQFDGDEKLNLGPAQIFADASREKPAVHAALRDLVLTPDQLQEELNPRTGKTK